MATKNKAPKKVTVFTARLRAEYEKVKKDPLQLPAFLKEKNIDANAMIYKPHEYSTYNHYVFFDCLEEASIESFQFFIDNGVDLTLTGYNGGTVLHSYRVNSHLAKLELALKNGAPPNAKDDDGNTAINELIRSYGDGKMDIDWNGETDNSKPKDFTGRLRLIELLLKYGASTTIKNNYGDCAMNWIEERKNEGNNDEDNRKLEELVKQYVKI